MTNKPIVLDIGQCDMDHRAIRGLLEELGATVHRARSLQEARALMCAHVYSVVLINRILDETGEEGIAFVDEVRAAGYPAMLVSNYADAQAEAVTRGALQGFGKAALRNPQTAHLLRRCLDEKSA
jgi:CheY-like chemotaxis protein